MSDNANPVPIEALNVERENAAAEYTRRNIGGMQPVVTVGARVHDAFVSGAEWAADLRHPAPIDREALAAEMFKHQPVMATNDWRLVGCQCMDRVFYGRSEDWGSHLADAVLAWLAGTNER